MPKLLAHNASQRWEVLSGTRCLARPVPTSRATLRSPGARLQPRQAPGCVQVVIALVVTPQGFPLAYEVMPGNTSDKTTLKDFLEVRSTVWTFGPSLVMDRGIPTEETLEHMRTAQPPVQLGGNAQGTLSKFLNLPWQAVRPSIDVLLAHDQLYILARSHPRILKERAMRWRRLKIPGDASTSCNNKPDPRCAAAQARGRQEGGWACLSSGRDSAPRPEPARHPRNLLLLPAPRQAAHRAPPRRPVSIALQPAQRRPRHLVAILHPPEQSCRDPPDYHQTQTIGPRFIAFIAYCLHVTLGAPARGPRTHAAAVLEKFATMQMVDVHLPPRWTSTGLAALHEPDSDHQLLFQQLKLNLPAQPPPRICV